MATDIGALESSPFPRLPRFFRPNFSRSTLEISRHGMGQLAVFGLNFAITGNWLASAEISMAVQIATVSFRLGHEQLADSRRELQLMLVEDAITPERIGRDLERIFGRRSSHKM